jgi:hypothetical protein
MKSWIVPIYTVLEKGYVIFHFIASKQRIANISAAFLPSVLKGEQNKATGAIADKHEE